MVVDAAPDADHDDNGDGLGLLDLDDEDEVDKLRRAALALDHAALVEKYIAETRCSRRSSARRSTR